MGNSLIKGTLSIIGNVNKILGDVYTNAKELTNPEFKTYQIRGEDFIAIYEQDDNGNSYLLGIELYVRWTNSKQLHVEELALNEINIDYLVRGFTEASEFLEPDNTIALTKDLEKAINDSLNKPLKTQQALHDSISELTQGYLEEVINLLSEEHYRVEDTDLQTVYDLKNEVIEKYLPMFNIDTKPLIETEVELPAFTKDVKEPAENYLMPFAVAKRSPIYKFTSELSIENLLKNIRSNDGMSERYAPVVLEFGHVDIELTIVIEDGEEPQTGYFVCAKDKDGSWFEYDYAEDEVKVTGDIEEDMFNILMKFAKKHNLFWSKPNEA